MSKVDRAMLRGRPLVMELLNEYRESECAIKEDRVTYYADRLDGRTEDERMDERTKTEQNGVGITDELRKWIDTIEWFEDSVTHKNILTIADHIDERYRRGMATAQQVGINEGEDAAMREGWVKLPIDADGVPIRVGDVMEGEKIGGGFGEPFEVVGYIMSNGELEPMDEHKCPRKQVYLRHHHEPTVEDVLREFGDWYAHTKGGCDEDGIIAEYAAKLRLAGEAQ